VAEWRAEKVSLKQLFVFCYGVGFVVDPNGMLNDIFNFF
jgi:hypothetical protein